MKGFKDYINALMNKKLGVIPEPIHFKHVGKNLEKKKKTKKKLEEEIADEFLKTNENSHLGRNKNEISKTLDTYNNFTDDHKDAISEYTGSSVSINEKLLKNESLGQIDQKTSENLDDAIDNNPIQHHVTVYSGTSFDPRQHIDENGQLKSPSYISTTHDKHIAHRFATLGHEMSGSEPGKEYHEKKQPPYHMLKIDLKPQDPATHVHFVSDYPEDHETIIKKNTTLQYNGTETFDDADDEGNQIHVHHMSIV